jgi:hypothetical protein
MSRLLVGTALTLLLAGPAWAQGDKKKTPLTDKQIAELITKLGHAHFEVRQEAYNALVKIGKPALPRLRKAAQSDEPEVQLRARKAIKEIEARPGLPPKRRGQAKKAGAPALLDDLMHLTNVSDSARVAFRDWKGPTVTVKDSQGKARAVVLQVRLQATIADLVGGKSTGQVALRARWQADPTFPSVLRGTFRLVEGKNGRVISVAGLRGGKLDMRYERKGNELYLRFDRRVTGLLGDPEIEFSGAYKLEMP